MFGQIRHAEKSRVIKIASVLIVALVGVMLLRPGHGKAEQAGKPSEARPALTVRTATLREDKWVRTLSATGSIVPWQEAIISAQVQGLRIAEVRVSIGDHVRQGQVLVTLDNFARGSRAGGLGSVQGRIVAPDSGIISAANATVGTMSQPGQELFRLIRQGKLEWRADLTADELMLLRKGMDVTVSVGEGHLIKGRVRAISPSVDSRTRYGYALVSLPNSSGIVAGAFARGTFDISGGVRKLQSLPAVAVLQRGEKTYVLVVDSENHVHERPVTVGQRQGDRVEIVEGLKADEPVVETGGAFLTDGDVVRVVKG